MCVSTSGTRGTRSPVGEASENAHKRQAKHHRDHVPEEELSSYVTSSHTSPSSTQIGRMFSADMAELYCFRAKSDHAADAPWAAAK